MSDTIFYSDKIIRPVEDENPYNLSYIACTTYRKYVIHNLDAILGKPELSTF
jgi:hypothetical protein